MLTLTGAPALSDFRISKLLAAVRARNPSIESLTSHFVHFVQTRRELLAEERRVLEALLTYGPRTESGAAANRGSLLVVTPRPGTISPWSSKATDIAHVCGLAAVGRIERGTAFRIQAQQPLSQADLQIDRTAAA